MNNGLFKRYKEKMLEVNELDRSLKDIILTGITALILAFLVVCGPTVLLINTYMFYDLIPLVILGITICAYVLIYLTRVFYLKGITKNECGSLKDVYAVEALIVLGIVVALFVIIMC